MNLDLMAREAYNAYWMCTLNGATSTQWEYLNEEVKQTWYVVIKSVLVNAVQLEVLHA